MRRIKRMAKYGRQVTRRRGGWLRSAGNLASKAIRGYAIAKGTRLGGSSSRTGTTRKNRSVETGPVTAERDVRVTYIKKRMPRAKKRQYVRKVKAYRSMVMKDHPCRISQFVDTDEIGVTENTSQYFGGFMGLMAQNNYDNNFGEVWNQITNSTAADDKAKAGSLRCDHMSLRILLRNRSSTSEPPLDIDVYKVVCTRDIPNDLWTSGLGIESMHASMKAQMRQHKGMDIEVDDAGTGIATAQTNAGTSSSNQVVGDTLFNAPPFLRYWKVVKCWKVYLPVGNTVEFNWRDSGNYNIPYTQCFSTDNAGLAAKKYVTKGYIFNVNGRYATATETGTTAKFLAANLVMEQYVRYNCKLRPTVADTLVYDGI